MQAGVSKLVKPSILSVLVAVLPIMSGCGQKMTSGSYSGASAKSGTVTAAVAGPVQVLVQSSAGEILNVDGLQFRDLNHDGILNPYEDWRLSNEARAKDLVGRMTLAEKAGAMMHASLRGQGPGGMWDANNYNMEQFAEALQARHISSFITRLSPEPGAFAVKNNELQKMAEATRLGIPITISTDPRNHFQYVVGASADVSSFSQWPEPMGFAALGDVERVKAFADIARQEYRAVGIHMALSPQADLATEPRWPRQVATFGSHAEKVSALAGAYVEGFQGSANGLTSSGVLTVTKHWVGYGAAVDGFDGHNYYGRNAQLNGDTLDQHVAAFKGPLAAKTGGIMPTYSVPLEATLNGAPLEQVGAGFSHQLLTDLLRGELGYDGIILSDWAITNDCTEACMNPTAELPQTPRAIATPWGVESATSYQRFVKGVLAGLDQFGGVENADYIEQAVKQGDLSEQRLDQSVQRIMVAKLLLGLFENPYVDVDGARAIVGAQGYIELGLKTQAQAQVLLENQEHFLPVSGKAKKVYLYGVAKRAAEEKGLVVVDDPAQADFAIIRATTPSEKLHPNHFFGSRQAEGRLNFVDGDAAYEELKRASAKVPTVFSVFLERPAILTEVKDKASAILANFGASDEAVLNVVLGDVKPLGKLPFELPVSMAAVESQHPGIADDTAEPLYPYGFGLTL